MNHSRFQACTLKSQRALEDNKELKFPGSSDHPEYSHSELEALFEKTPARITSGGADWSKPITEGLIGLRSDWKMSVRAGGVCFPGDAGGLEACQALCWQQLGSGQLQLKGVMAAADEGDATGEAAVVERGPGALYHMFVMMEDLLEKLKLLNCEEEAALRSHNMRPPSR